MTNWTDDELDAIRTRYSQERDARLVVPGRDESADVAEVAPETSGDPFTPTCSRGPFHGEVDAVVVGGGFGGLVAAARLRQQGLQRICIIDNAGDFGGTWYWNRYPNIACDVESYIYLPLLEEVGYIPKERYSKGPEIFAHAQRLGRHFDLYADALFHTKVDDATWDDDNARWIVSTDRGDRVVGRFMVLAVGFLHAPKISAIPGIGRFEGKAFHTSRWDYNYTGGAPGDNRLDRLSDKVVGIIGTGATAIQIVPALAKSAKHLFVFQRTPSTVGVRANRPTDQDWADSLDGGWQMERIKNFTAIMSGESRGDVDLVSDSWTDLMKAIRIGDPPFANMATADAVRAKELADLEKMREMHARIESLVEDEETAEALKPYYYYQCKRPCFHDEYLLAFNRPNVTLVNSPRGVQRVRETGVEVEGVPYELDCLVFSTGFESLFSSFVDKAGFDITGRHGLTLSKKFDNDIATLHGITTHGFPNMFFMPAPYFQSAMSPNHTHAVLENAAHIAYIVGEVMRRGADVAETTEAAEDAWVRTVLKVANKDSPGAAASVVAFQEACTPGYLNNQGKARQVPLSASSYAKPLEYFEILAGWRESGDLRGIELDRR
jgi:cyclohexanone monooxygenase